MPIPIVLAASLAAKGIQMYSNNRKRKREGEIDAQIQEELIRGQRISQGRQIVNQSQALAIPSDPMIDNVRELNAMGGNAKKKKKRLYNLGGEGLDMEGYGSIASSALDIAGTFMDSSAHKKELDAKLNRSREVKLAPIDPMFGIAAKKDAEAAKLESDQMLNKRDFAQGGNAEEDIPKVGLKHTSSNTVVIDAGTHESGNDMEFTRPDGTKAKIEGDEVIHTSKGRTKILSNRMINPITGESFASDAHNVSLLKGDLEESRRTTADNVKANTLDREILGKENLLDSYYNAQEEVKQLKGNKQIEANYANGGNPDDDTLSIKTNPSGAPLVQDPLENASHYFDLKRGKHKGFTVGQSQKVEAGSPEEAELRRLYDYPYTNFAPITKEDGSSSIFPVLDSKQHADIVKDKGLTSKTVKEFAIGGNGDEEEEDFDFFTSASKQINKDVPAFASDNTGFVPDETKRKFVESGEYTKTNPQRNVKDAVEAETKKVKGKDGKGVGNALRRLGSTDNLNVAMTGLTLLDNIYNASQLKKIQDNFTDPRYVSKVDLDTEYDVSGAEHAAKASLDTFYKNVDKNTTSSIVGLNMKQAALASTIKQLNKVHDTKQKVETELRNKETLANLNVDRFNAGLYNQTLARKANIEYQKSANFSNMIDDVTRGISRGIGIKRDRETFAAQQMMQLPTGTIIKNVEAGHYAEMDPDVAKAEFDRALNSGGLSKDDYASIIKSFNAKSKRGKIKV